MAEEVKKCSRVDCLSKLPAGTQIPEGWTVGRMETYGRETVEVFYVYICPNCVLDAHGKQGQLFSKNEVSG